MNENTKPVQILLNPTAHEIAKTCAKKLGMNVGPFYENLFAAFIIRLERAKKYFEHEGKQILSDRKIMRLLLIADEIGCFDDWGNKRMKEEIEKIQIKKVSKDDSLWVPIIKIPKD